MRTLTKRKPQSMVVVGGNCPRSTGCGLRNFPLLLLTAHCLWNNRRHRLDGDFLVDVLPGFDLDLDRQRWIGLDLHAVGSTESDRIETRQQVIEHGLPGPVLVVVIQHPLLVTDLHLDGRWQKARGQLGVRVELDGQHDRRYGSLGPRPGDRFTGLIENWKSQCPRECNGPWMSHGNMSLQKK